MNNIVARKLFGAATVLAIAGKLTGVIHWSWWVVLAPIWMPLSLAMILGVAVWCYFLFMDILEGS